MILSRIFPGGGEAGAQFECASTVDPERIDLAADFRGALAQWYGIPRRDWLRINLVSSVNGSAAGADGTSNALTNRVDRKILGAIRRLSDVVLVGASSLRSERYLLPRTAVLAVVTASGDLTGHCIPADVPAGRVIVLCADVALPRVRESLGGAAAEVITVATDHGRIPVSGVVAALRARGLSSIVCEGGPNLAAQLVGAGLVDELCLTTSPTLSPAPLPVLPLLPEADAVPLRLSQLLVDESRTLYARWRFPTPQANE